MSGWPVVDIGWRSAARCRGQDPRLFDPPELAESRHGARRRLATAGRVCAGCPVAAECLSEALRLGDAGVRGGLLLRRRNSAAAAVTAARADRAVQPCGTYAAWRRHRRRDEPSDPACDAARNAYAAAQRRRRAA